MGGKRLFGALLPASAAIFALVFLAEAVSIGMAGDAVAGFALTVLYIGSIVIVLRMAGERRDEQGKTQWKVFQPAFRAFNAPSQSCHNPLVYLRITIIYYQETLL